MGLQLFPGSNAIGSADGVLQQHMHASHVLVGFYRKNCHGGLGKYLPSVYLGLFRVMLP